MGLVTARPAFRHVRVCVACDGRIDADGGCKCSAPSPFRRGASVTICSDAAGETPIRIEKIARIGNGGFRIAGGAAWYGFDGSPQSGADGTWCRPTRETDAAIISARVLAASRDRRRAYAEEQMRYAAHDLKEAMASERWITSEAKRYAYSALRIDPVAEGEKARAAAERTATEAIYYCLFEEIDQRARAERVRESIRKIEDRIARYQTEIVEIKAEE